MTLTVKQILYGDTEESVGAKTPLSRSLKRMRKIGRLIDRLVEAVRTDEDGREEDWQMIFNAIFSMDNPDRLTARVHKALEIAGLSFPDYYDPDTTYQADATAWISAFREKLESVERARRAELDGDD
jgi:hypothetical protein